MQGEQYVVRLKCTGTHLTNGTKRSGAAQSPVDGINRMCDSPSPRLMLDLEVKSLFLLTKQNKTKQKKHQPDTQQQLPTQTIPNLKKEDQKKNKRN